MNVTTKNALIKDALSFGAVFLFMLVFGIYGAYQAGPLSKFGLVCIAMCIAAGVIYGITIVSRIMSDKS